MPVIPTSTQYISDTDILQLSNTQLMKIWAYNEYPWLATLNYTDAQSGSDTTDYWINNIEDMVHTQLNMASPGMTGGAYETITVDATENFKANNTVLFQANGSNAAQLAYISAVNSSTTMTVYPLSGTLHSHDDGTHIYLTGDYVVYGDSVDQPLALPTRDSNTIEQLGMDSKIAKNTAAAKFLTGEKLEAYLTRQCLSQWKQKASFATLFGSAKTAAANSGKAKMDGLINLIDSNNITTSAITLANFRTHITTLKKRGGFPDGRGLIIANSEAIEDVYTFDDSQTGPATTLDRDKPFRDIWIRGVRFTVIEDRTMNKYFKSTTAAAFTLSTTAQGAKLLQLARIPVMQPTGSKPRTVVNEEYYYKLQMVEWCTLRLVDPYRHGLIRSATA